MTDTVAAATRVSSPQLEAFIARALEAVSVPRGDAKIIAGLMTRADLNGADGHGVFRLPQYIRRIKGGAVNVKPDIRVEREAPGMALVDGDNGMGHLVMRFATEKAIEKAKTAGVAWVGVKWSNHAGPASLYARGFQVAHQPRQLEHRCHARAVVVGAGRALHRIVVRADDHDFSGARAAGDLDFDIANSNAIGREALGRWRVTEAGQRIFDVTCRRFERLDVPQVMFAAGNGNDVAAQIVAQQRFFIRARQQWPGV